MQPHRDYGEGGRLVAASVLIGFNSEDDWLEYRLENHPKFLARIAEARETLHQGKGVKLEEIDE